MTNLVNHPGKWLRDDAAQSLARLERDTGVISVNSAGRTEAEQQGLINRWRQGGAKNRPPYLYKPQEPASKSNHVQNGSVAVDTNHITHMLKHGPAYGWFRPFAGDPVHFEYYPAKDGKRVSSAPAVGTKNTATERQQAWLNASRGEKLVVDGREGDNTRAAYKRYQEFLKSWGYKGEIDGKWGPGTQAAHQRYYDELSKPKAPAHSASAGSVPAGLKWNGIQDMLRAKFDYKGSSDNVPGRGTIGAFQRFLNASGYDAGAADEVWGKRTGEAAQRWLKAKWGYAGAIDNDFGGGTKAAWARAEAANGKAF